MKAERRHERQSGHTGVLQMSSPQPSTHTHTPMILLPNQPRTRSTSPQPLSLSRRGANLLPDQGGIKGGFAEDQTAPRNSPTVSPTHSHTHTPPTSENPIICFGQQPCGFFPKRFLAAKIFTARRLQREIGGEIVFFYHDSDHDPRETKTILRHRKLNEPIEHNFTFANKLQKKYTPLYLKRVLPEWHEKMVIQLPAWVEPDGVEAFRNSPVTNVADFCLEMYRRMGLLEGVRVVRSSDPAFRRAACEVPDFFIDVPHEGEIVRARHIIGELKLHKGGDEYITLPPAAFTREQVSPTRDTRLRWMQSVIHCTHYVSGAGEGAYLRKEEAPEITYHQRDSIDRADEAYTQFSD